MGDSFDRWVTQLNSDNENTRQNGVYKLGKSGRTEVVELLEKSANDTSVIVRCRTAKALANFGEHEKTLGILEKLLQDENRNVYGCACSALSEIQSQDAIDILIDEVVNNEKHGRNIGANNLIKAGGSVVPKVMKAYYKSSGELRATFLKVLGRIEDPRSKSILIEALNDEDDTVNWVATAIQRNVQDPDAVPPLILELTHESPMRQYRAVRTLWYVGDVRASKPLRKYVEDRHNDIRNRSSALSALIRNDGKNVKKFAWSILNSRRSPMELRRCAFVALSCIGDVSLVEPLIQIANQNYRSLWHLGIIQKLGRYGDDEVHEKLRQLLDGNPNKYELSVIFAIERTLEAWQ